MRGFRETPAARRRKRQRRSNAPGHATTGCRRPIASRSRARLIFVLDVADISFGFGSSKLGEASLPLGRADRVEHLGPGLGEQLAHVPGHALAIGHAADETVLPASCRKSKVMRSASRLDSSNAAHGQRGVRGPPSLTLDDKPAINRPDTRQPTGQRRRTRTARPPCPRKGPWPSGKTRRPAARSARLRSRSCRRAGPSA